MSCLKSLGFHSCGVCKINPNKEPRCCSICSEHLCNGHPDCNGTVCFGCIEQWGVDIIYKRNEKGQLIDPLTQKPIPTCICGKRWHSNSLCIAHFLQNSLHGKPVEHSPIK